MYRNSKFFYNSQNMSRRHGVGLFIIIFFGFVLYWYGPFLGSLNQSFFNGGGDGLKTYYNVTYHAKYGDSVLQHEGMSYPFGEYLFLEDCMPGLSIALKQFIYIFPFAGDYIVGIINVLFFVSLFVGAFLLYHLLVKLKVNIIPAAIAANAILFLSSQNILLFPAGHIALTYSAFFISGWYFLINYFESNHKSKWSIAIAINCIFWAFIHAYLGLILLMFTLVVHLVSTFRNLSSPHQLSSKYLWPLFQIVGPLVIFVLFYKVFDQHPDRIDMPFIESHRSTMTSVFVPSISPLLDFLEHHITLADRSIFYWTSVGTYVGIVSIITLLFFITESTLAFFRGKVRVYLDQFPKVMVLSLLSAVLVLLFSFALPFRWFPDSVLNQLPYIKQFSSYGRFAWPFYYVVTTFSIVFWSERLRHFHWRKWVLVATAILFLAEAMPIHKFLSNSILQSKNSFNLKYLPEEYNSLNIKNPQNFQAILPLPAFFIYGLPFSMRSHHGSIYGALSASALTGLPVLSTFLSRPSVSESMNIFKFISPHPYQRNIEMIVNDGRDIAVVVLLLDTMYMTQNEKLLLSKCKPVEIGPLYALYSLSIGDIAFYEKPEFDSIAIRTDSIWTVPADKFYYFDNLDILKSRQVYLGEGAFEGKKREWNQIFKISTAEMDTGVTYSLSYWYYNHVWDQTFNTAIVHESDPDGQTVQWLYYSPIEATVTDGWWYFTEYEFNLKSNNSDLALLFNGENKFEPWFAVDEILLRRADTDVLRCIMKDSVAHVFKNGLLLGLYDGKQ